MCHPFFFVCVYKELMRYAAKQTVFTPVLTSAECVNSGDSGRFDSLPEDTEQASFCQVVSFSHSHIGDLGLRHLSIMKRVHPQLVQLDLSFCSLTFQCIDILQWLLSPKLLPHLIDFNLVGNFPTHHNLDGEAGRFLDNVGSCWQVHPSLLLLKLEPWFRTAFYDEVRLNKLSRYREACLSGNQTVHQENERAVSSILFSQVSLPDELLHAAAGTQSWQGNLDLDHNVLSAMIQMQLQERRNRERLERTESSDFRQVVKDIESLPRPPVVSQRVLAVQELEHEMRLMREQRAEESRKKIVTLFYKKYDAIAQTHNS